MTRTCQATGEAVLVPSRNRRSKVDRITGGPGKTVEDETVAAGSVVALKRGNARGAKGPCCTQLLRQRAAFPHYALLHTSREGLCDLSSRGVFRRIYEISNSVIEQSDSRVHPSPCRPVPHPTQWPKGPLRLASARTHARTDRRAPRPTASGSTDLLGLADPHSDDKGTCLGASRSRRAVSR